jgi:GNAT superfamily N-acetyltransferase
VRLRPATREDIPALTELSRACDVSQRDWAGPGIPIPTTEEQSLEWDLRFARAGAWICVAEEDDGRIVGAAAFAAGTVSRQDRTTVPGLAHVNAVFVHPDRWRRGIARQLLEQAEDAMRAAGFDRAQLFTLKGSPAEQLYQATGWRHDGREEPYPPMRLMTKAYVKALG